MNDYTDKTRQDLVDELLRLRSRLDGLKSPAAEDARRRESLGTLAGGIAHDFNNGLMGILLHADLLSEDLIAGSAAHRHASDILEAAGQLSVLTKRMLAYAGRPTLDLTEVDLSVLLSGLHDRLAATTSEQVELTFNLSEGLPTIEGDASQIAQVLTSLVFNATEAIGALPGEIIVSTGAKRTAHAPSAGGRRDAPLPSGHYVTLSVTDTGSGMTPETRARVFDPFFTTKFTGRGLGLAEVMGIVQSHKGGIDIETSLGTGTTFTTYWPTHKDHRRRSRSEGGLGEGLTALLVDDDELVRRVGRVGLRRLGMTVIEACDGLEAVEVFAKHGDKISVVLMDLSMPRMDGEEAFREIRLIRPDVPILVSSGYDERETASHFEGALRTGFLQKPYRLNALRCKLIDVLHPLG